MPERLPGNACLPPGVRESDISYPEPVECALCEGEGKIDATACCGAAFVENASGYHCLRCHKQYDSRQCPECEGEGVIDS